jgi:hypothetical protein
MAIYTEFTMQCLKLFQFFSNELRPSTSSGDPCQSAGIFWHPANTELKPEPDDVLRDLCFFLIEK